MKFESLVLITICTIILVSSLLEVVTGKKGKPTIYVVGGGKGYGGGMSVKVYKAKKKKKKAEVYMLMPKKPKKKKKKKKKQFHGIIMDDGGY